MTGGWYAGVGSQDGACAPQRAASQAAIRESRTWRGGGLRVVTTVSMASITREPSARWVPKRPEPAHAGPERPLGGVVRRLAPRMAHNRPQRLPHVEDLGDSPLRVWARHRFGRPPAAVPRPGGAAVCFGPNTGVRQRPIADPRPPVKPRWAGVRNPTPRSREAAARAHGVEVPPQMGPAPRPPPPGRPAIRTPALRNPPPQHGAPSRPRPGAPWDHRTTRPVTPAVTAVHRQARGRPSLHPVSPERRRAGPGNRLVVPDRLNHGLDQGLLQVRPRAQAHRDVKRSSRTVREVRLRRR